jgi:hypothetical protein
LGKYARFELVIISGNAPLKRGNPLF